MIRAWLNWLMPAFGGGGSSTPSTSTQTTVQKSDPWSGIQPYLTQGYEQAWNLANSAGPQMYPGSVVPQDSADTVLSQAMRRQFAGDATSAFTAPAYNAWQQQLGAADMNTPLVQNALSAIINPVQRDLTENILPGLESQSITQGAYSGNRYALSQAMATEKSAEAMSRASQAALLPLYQTGLEASGRALAMTPTMEQLALAPSTVLSDLGKETETKDAARLQEQKTKYEYDQQLPYMKIANFLNLIQGGGGVGSQSTSTTSGTQQQATSQDPMSSVLGGLMMAMMFM